MQMLEDDTVLLHVLDDAATRSDGGPNVSIGSENKTPRRFQAFRWWQAATGTGTTAGVVAVIGPTRMDYSQVIQRSSRGKRRA